MDKEKFEQAALEILSTIVSREKTMDNSSTEEIRTLLAYEMWQDGMDWPEVEKFIQDKEMTREQMIEYLNMVFPLS